MSILKFPKTPANFPRRVILFSNGPETIIQTVSVYGLQLFFKTNLMGGLT